MSFVCGCSQHLVGSHQHGKSVKTKFCCKPSDMSVGHMFDTFFQFDIELLPTESTEEIMLIMLISQALFNQILRELCNQGLKGGKIFSSSKIFGWRIRDLQQIFKFRVGGRSIIGRDGAERV